MASCGAFINPLDLECIFVNYLSGDWIIFGLLALLFIVGLAAQFRMSNGLVGASILLFAIMFYAELPWLLYMGIIVGGTVIGIVVASIWKR